MERKLYRSRTDRMIFGVCGGLGKYFALDSTIIRIIFVMLVFAGGIGILAYIVMAIIVPLEQSQKTAPQDIIEENVQDIRQTATKMGTEIRDAFSGGEDASKENVQVTRRRNALAIILIIVGVLVLLSSLGIWHWFNWGVIVALILIAIGVLLIVSLSRR